MIRSDKVGALQLEAEDGRGFWIGLDMDVDQFATHPLHQMVPPHPHVTVLHLGKSVSALEVANICEALADLEPRINPTRLEMTGAGWFSRHRGPPTLVALVSSSSLCDVLRPMLISAIRPIRPLSRDYGFIPHVSLGDPMLVSAKTPVDVAQVLGSMRPLQIIVDTITVHCGGVRARLDGRDNEAGPNGGASPAPAPPETPF